MDIHYTELKDVQIVSAKIAFMWGVLGSSLGTGWAAVFSGSVKPLEDLCVEGRPVEVLGGNLIKMLPVKQEGECICRNT